MLIETRARVMTPAQAAEYLGLSYDALQKMRARGNGPVFMPWGRRMIRYRISDLDAWIDNQPTCQNTGEAAALLRTA